jgi:hypothetical protein
VGTTIIAALTMWVDAAAFLNTVVGFLPMPGLIRFYQRHGYTPQPSNSPAMIKWVNPQTRGVTGARVRHERPVNPTRDIPAAVAL